MALDALNLSVKEVDVNMDRDEHKSPDMITVIKCQARSFPAKPKAQSIDCTLRCTNSISNIGTVSDLLLLTQIFKKSINLLIFCFLLQMNSLQTLPILKDRGLVITDR